MKWEVLKRIFDDLNGNTTFETLIHLDLNNGYTHKSESAMLSE